MLAMLYTQHEAKNIHTGLVTHSNGSVSIADAVAHNVKDLFILKYWAIRFATIAATTVLRVDQVSAMIKVM